MAKVILIGFLGIEDSMLLSASNSSASLLNSFVSPSESSSWPSASEISLPPLEPSPSEPSLPSGALPLESASSFSSDSLPSWDAESLPLPSEVTGDSGLVCWEWVLDVELEQNVSFSVLQIGVLEQERGVWLNQPYWLVKQL